MKRELDYFFIAGAQRSGTTFLYNLLNQHPQILMAKPNKPEPKFFINQKEFEKGKDYYLKTYFSDRANVSGIKILGEKSTSYLEYDYVPKRVKQYFKSSKALVSLRNPVDRAISNYFFTKKHGLETRTLHQVFVERRSEPILNTKISVSPFSYIERGEYMNYLIPYVKEFKEKLKIIIFENFKESTVLQNEIFDFLQVSSYQINSNELARNEGLYEGENNEVMNEVKHLLYNYYKDEILKLEDYLKIDLSIWKMK